MSGIPIGNMERCRLTKPPTLSCWTMISRPSSPADQLDADLFDNLRRRWRTSPSTCPSPAFAVCRSFAHPSLSPRSMSPSSNSSSNPPQSFRGPRGGCRPEQHRSSTKHFNQQMVTKSLQLRHVICRNIRITLTRRHRRSSDLRPSRACVIVDVGLIQITIRSSFKHHPRVHDSFESRHVVDLLRAFVCLALVLSVSRFFRRSPVWARFSAVTWVVGAREQ